MQRVNPAWTTILGYQPADLLGHHVHEFVWPEDLELNYRASKQATAVSFAGVENSDTRMYVPMVLLGFESECRDDLCERPITAMKDAEAALARSEEALRQAQKMEAVGQLPRRTSVSGRSLSRSRGKSSLAPSLLGSGGSRTSGRESSPGSRRGLGIVSIHSLVSDGFLGAPMHHAANPKYKTAPT